MMTVMNEAQLSAWAKLVFRFGSCLSQPQNNIFYPQSTQWSCHNGNRIEALKFLPPVQEAQVHVPHQHPQI